MSLLPFLQEFSKTWYLAGGTAIALYLGHRTSIDFDMFSGKPFDTLSIDHITTKFQLRPETVLQKTANEYTLVLKGVKVSFIFYPFVIPIDKRWKTIGLPSLLTLSAMKAYTLGRRGKWKDYVDFYYLIRDRFSIEEIARHAQSLYGGAFNEKLLREQLCYFEDIDFSEEVDLLTDQPSQSDIQNFLVERALDVPL